jgi:hypothetical protein
MEVFPEWTPQLGAELGPDASITMRGSFAPNHKATATIPARMTLTTAATFKPA